MDCLVFEGWRKKGRGNRLVNSIVFVKIWVALWIADFSMKVQSYKNESMA